MHVPIGDTAKSAVLFAIIMQVLAAQNANYPLFIPGYRFVGTVTLLLKEND